MKRSLFAILLSLTVLLGLSSVTFASESFFSMLLETLVSGDPSLEISNESEERDGVTVTLLGATAVRKTKPDRFEYSFRGTIENNTDEGIMKVIYSFSLYDEEGEEFRSFALVYDGVTEAIPPHTTIEFSHDGIKWGAQSVPSAVAIGLGSVQTETELPPVHLPETGDALYEALGDERLAKIREEPPVEMSFHIDQGGYGRTAVFGPGEELQKAVELFCEIRIGEETGEWVTDNYNWIGFTWEDGSRTFISLNLYNLEFFAHSTSFMYRLQNLGEFWAYAEEFLTVD